MKIYNAAKPFCLCLVLAAVLSCSYKPEYETVTYEKFYRVEKIQIINSRLFIDGFFDSSTDAASLEFYESRDTSLTFVRRKPNLRTHREYEAVNVLDLRFAKITVTALTDYDDEHLKGSVLNDVLQIDFRYKGKMCSIPLKRLESENLMLVDYYYYSDESTEIFFNKLGKRHGYVDDLCDLDVVIEDAFGNTFHTSQSDNH